MLLSKKSNHKVERDWALIVNRVARDFSNRRAIDQLVGIFHFSPGEAGDLMANTPIVLLDGLSLEVAERIRAYFLRAGVDCSVTDAVLAKRKCFRAIWPEPPDLSLVLGEASESDLESKEPEKRSGLFASADEVLRPISEAEAVEVGRGVSSSSLAEQVPFPQGDQELKGLTLELQRENEILRRQLDQVEHSARVKSSEMARVTEQLNAQIEQLRSDRMKSDATHRGLEEEQSRLLSNLKERERELERARHEASVARGAREPEVTELRLQLEQMRSEHARTQNALRVVQNEAKQFQTEWTQTQSALSEARSECEDLKQMLDQAQSDCVQLKEEVEQVRGGLEERLRAQSLDLEEWKRKAGEWSAHCAKAMKENEFLRAHQAEELESLRVRNRELTEQLEGARAQNRDFMAQLEQQALIEKRLKSVQELNEHEAQLKELVQKQQQLEEEIRLREEQMKTVLAAQEESEREVVRLKQSQKYLMEQTKMKDRVRFARSRLGASPSVVPPEDPGSARSPAN